MEEEGGSLSAGPGCNSPGPFSCLYSPDRRNGFFSETELPVETV